MGGWGRLGVFGGIFSKVEGGWTFLWVGEGGWRYIFGR